MKSSSLRERAAVDLAPHEQRYQVLARPLALRPDVLHDEARELAQRRHRLVGRQVR